MPAALHLKPEDLDAVEKRRIYTIAVFGCGQQGLQYAKAFADAGFKVVCADADQSVVKRVSKGNLNFASREAQSKWRSLMRTEQLETTSDLSKAAAQSSILVVTVDTKLGEKKNADTTEVEGVCRQIAASLQRESLVVYGGVAGIGFTTGLFRETLENASGLKAKEDFGLVFSNLQKKLPEQGENASSDLRIAAEDKATLNSATALFEATAKFKVQQVADVKLAELTALFAAGMRDVNAALANELAVFCEHAGVDFAEAKKLVSTVGCEGFSATIAEETNRDEAYLLLEASEALNAKLRLQSLARQVNEDMVRHAIGLTQDALRESGKTLRRARLALLGAAAAGTGASAFVDAFEAKGARITRYDSSGLEVDHAEEKNAFKKTLNESVEGVDCVVILGEQEQYGRLNLKKLRALMKSPAALVDLSGVVHPGNVEDAGFVYRGLGRGVWKR